MDFSKINLHIHSSFSDGRNTIKQIVKKAIKTGMELIAITDHSTNSWKSGIIPSLNTDDKFINYLEEISEIQLNLKRQGSKLKILKGVELDLGSSVNFIKKLIKPKEFDIILFEYLESLESIAFIKNIIEFWKNKTSDDDLPIFGLAHFDPSNFILHGGLNILIKFLADYNIFFEFNSRYPEFYSRRNELFFNKLKEKEIQVSIGSDCHTANRINDVDEPLDMISYYDLMDNFKQLINNLEMKLKYE